MEDFMTHVLYKLPTLMYLAFVFPFSLPFTIISQLFIFIFIIIEKYNITF